MQSKYHSDLYSAAGCLPCCCDSQNMCFVHSFEQTPRLVNYKCAIRNCISPKKDKKLECDFLKTYNVEKIEYSRDDGTQVGL